ncbi:hypothetical protein [Noviherbaspirillum pedocola]|uniref:Uncharacterized protein n=1 Tax=Noviherbaspirillum pedocola TaxID=2801341 RepID=A0A934SZG2_9BURK|nr:hypothetical protein [Noviherbaspirillum pedocola]MBK4735539.1 hypothetical protein [Noviherbaspirillum pedocola]
MAREKILEQVYKAIGALRAKGGGSLNVAQVAKQSKLARTTFYQDDPEWVEVRDVIHGKPSPKVPLVEVSTPIATESETKVARLATRVDEIETRIRNLEQLSDVAYRRMADQILYYATIASETPKKLENRGRNIRELNAALDENRKLRAALAEAGAAADAPAGAAALVSKKIIALPSELQPDDIYDRFLSELHNMIPSRGAGTPVVAVYLLCGLPLSGRSKWIDQHKVGGPGVALYVETTGHNAKIRSRFIDRLREKSDASIHCVRLRADVATCIQRSSLQNQGAKHLLTERRIQKLATDFEEVSLAEQFNSIILA